MRRKHILVTLLVVLAVLANAGPGLAAGGKRRITKVKAPIVSIDESAGIWQIGDMEVLVTEATMVVEEEGIAEPGAIVQLVYGQSGDEPYEAILIRVLVPYNEQTVITVRGSATAYDGDTLIVNGMTIQITPDTSITGEITVGALVKVEVLLGETDYVAVSIQVLQVRASTTVDFEGVVEAIDGDTWTVSGREVVVTDETELENDPQVGDSVAVKARVMADGTLVAVRIRAQVGTPEPREITFEGTIQRFPTDGVGLWVIEGRQVFVSESTVLVGEPQLGALAVVLASYRGNGRLDAIEITVENIQPTGLISGVIGKLPGGTYGRWQVGEWGVQVGPDTIIEGDTPVVGAWAEVEVERKGQMGTLFAIRIKVTSTETPVPTVPPNPNETPAPTIPPSVTPDPSPNPSSTAEPSPSPSPSRSRTKTPKPSKTPKTPKPSRTRPNAVETPSPEELVVNMARGQRAGQ